MNLLTHHFWVHVNVPPGQNSTPSDNNETVPLSSRNFVLSPNTPPDKSNQEPMDQYCRKRRARDPVETDFPGSKKLKRAVCLFMENLFKKLPDIAVQVEERLS